MINKRGYSLLELLLVLTVIMVVLAASLRGMGYYRSKVQVNRMQESLQQLILLGKQYYAANCTNAGIQPASLVTMKNWAVNNQMFTAKQLSLIGNEWDLTYVKTSKASDPLVYMIKISASYPAAQDEELAYWQGELHADPVITNKTLTWTMRPRQIFPDQEGNSIWIADNNLQYFANSNKISGTQDSVCPA